MIDGVEVYQITSLISVEQYMLNYLSDNYNVQIDWEFFDEKLQLEIWI